MAFVRLLRLKEGFATWTLQQLLVNLALDALVAGIMLYSGRWSIQLE
jgi:hypothetical protein